MNGFWFAILLTTLAGLSTSLGALISLLIRAPGGLFMSLALGFSAGVMVLVSFVELLPQGVNGIGFLWAHAAFFGGMLAAYGIDVLVPHSFGAEEQEGLHPHDKKLLRTGLFVALGLGIHNFPEGMATFVSTLANPKLGLALAVAIAIHNVPEGIAVAAPVYAATKSHAKAFVWSSLSGLAEPIGALLAAAVLLPFLNATVLAIVLAVVAGIMVYIALDELLPASREYGREHLSILGVLAGMVIMAASLQLLRS
jgi:ZIP family zinc transporter